MKLLLFSDCCCLIGMGHAPAGHRPLLLWFFVCWFSCVVASIFPPLFLSFFPKIGKKLSMQMCFHHFSIEKFSPNHWSDVGGCFLFISFFPPFLYIIRLLFYFHYYYYLLLAGRTGFLFSIHWFPPPPQPPPLPRFSCCHLVSFYWTISIGGVSPSFPIDRRGRWRHQRQRCSLAAPPDTPPPIRQHCGAGENQGRPWRSLAAESDTSRWANRAAAGGGEKQGRPWRALAVALGATGGR